MQTLICPHCGTSFSDAGDAFCPECREPLNEGLIASQAESRDTAVNSENDNRIQLDQEQAATGQDEKRAFAIMHLTFWLYIILGYLAVSMAIEILAPSIPALLKPFAVIPVMIVAVAIPILGFFAGILCVGAGIYSLMSYGDWSSFLLTLPAAALPLSIIWDNLIASKA